MILANTKVALRKSISVARWCSALFLYFNKHAPVLPSLNLLNKCPQVRSSHVKNVTAKDKGKDNTDGLERHTLRSSLCLPCNQPAASPPTRSHGRRKHVSIQSTMLFTDRTTCFPESSCKGLSKRPVHSDLITARNSDCSIFCLAKNAKGVPPLTLSYRHGRISRSIDIYVCSNENASLILVTEISST